jgi:hypothetical protein
MGGDGKSDPETAGGLSDGGEGEYEVEAESSLICVHLRSSAANMRWFSLFLNSQQEYTAADKRR